MAKTSEFYPGNQQSEQVFMHYESLEYSALVFHLTSIFQTLQSHGT